MESVIIILVFGPARDALGCGEATLAQSPDRTPLDLVRHLRPGWTPPSGWRVALDRAYGDWNQPVGAAREIAILPPVSGG